MKTKKVISNFFTFLLACLIVSGCKKNTASSLIETNTTLRVFVKDSHETNIYIHPAPDGGLIFINSTDFRNSKDRKGLEVVKTDASGKQEWSYKLKDSISEPHISGLKDGSIAICSGIDKGWLIRLDPNGQLVSKLLFVSGFPSGNYSFPVQKPDGGFAITYTNGWATGAASTNIIHNFNANGTYKNQINVHDSVFGGKMYVMDLYNYKDTGIYYIYGIVYKYPFSWTNNPHIFVSSLQFSGTKILMRKTNFLDLENITNTNWPFYKNYTYLRSLVTPDGGIVISTMQYQQQVNYMGHIVKADKDLNKVWDLDLIIGNGNTVPKSITLTADGNYLVCGLCYDLGKFIDQPFACKISTGGKILWTKIYNMPKTSTLNYGFEKNGRLYFGGTTNSFGNGKNSDDVFFMKTDINGNVN